MLKYLRIAVTTLSLTACVLLIALWVRAYSWCDWMGGTVIGQYVVVISTWSDFVAIQVFGDSPAQPWSWRVHPISDADRFAGIWGWFHLPDDNMPALIVPHWFLVLSSAIFAVAPWLPRRFSLRTLLIAITLIAVVLGIIAYLMR